MDIDSIKRFVCEVITTYTDEMSCQECFELIDRYTEVVLLDEGAALRFPRVHDHLQRCTDCREEWSALLAALQVSPDRLMPTQRSARNPGSQQGADQNG